MTDSILTGLVSDQRRHAVPVHCGYYYQEWRSVWAWIQLKPGEVLFLEGAEDFDVLGGTSAEVVQVKRTSRRVTLSSRDILAAISNFWGHRTNNPGCEIRFRFLTTSERGRERSALLHGACGLDHWDQCKRRSSNLDPVRNFLRGRRELSRDLRNFVATSSDEELRGELIARIEWDTGQAGMEEIEDLVNRAAIVYGEGLHLYPSESQKVVAHLLKRVRDVICKEETRRLDRADFAQLFEQVTAEPRPKREHRQIEALLQRSIRPQFDQTSTSAEDVTNVVEIVQTQALLPSTKRLAQRKALVTELRSRMAATGVLVVAGSMGMGKSTLASLIAADEPAAWHRVDVSRMEARRIGDWFMRAAINDRKNGQGVDYIIDDLNFDREVVAYEKTLVTFLYVILKRGGRVIITTQGALPPAVTLRLDLPANSTMNVPPLGYDDIGELATSYGCPPDSLEAWTRIIEAKTAGHPILVHARIKGLKATHWPKPRLEDIVSSVDIDEARQQVRQKLVELLPSEQARTLVYRLGILFAYFKRVHALEMAQSKPVIPNPGEAFDRLVGPWVEHLGHGYHRVSPLLKGTNMFSSEETKTLHRCASAAYLADRTVTPRELSGVLFHGLAGEEPGSLVIAAQLCLGIKDQDWPVVARELEWLTFIFIAPGQRLFPSEPRLSLMLRLVQFRVALEVDSKACAPCILQCWSKEFELLSRSERHSEWCLAWELAFCHQALSSLSVPLAPTFIVGTIARAVALTKQVKVALPQNPLLRQLLGGMIDGLDKLEDFVWGAALRHLNVDEADEFFSTLSNVEPHLSREIWVVLKDNDYLSTILLDNMWLKEENAAEPRWNKCIEVVDRISLLAEANESYSPLAVTCRIKAIIFKEYLHDSEAAFKAITEGYARCRAEHRVLREYHAKILVLEKRGKEALKIWETLLPELEQARVPTRTFSYRDACMAAEEVGDWYRAAEFALQAEKTARDARFSESLILGFAACRAWLLWMAKEYETCLISFIELIRRFSELSELEADPKLVAIYRKVIHVLFWIEDAATGKADLVRPQTAWFTDENILQGKEITLVNSEPYIWYLLAKLEHRYGLGGVAFERFEEVGQRASQAVIRCAVEEMRIKRLLRVFDVDGLMDQYAAFSRMLEVLPEAEGGVKGSQCRPKVLIDLILTALIRLVMAGGDRNVPISTWRNGATRRGFVDEPVGALLNFIDTVSDLGEGGLVKVVKNLSASWSARLAATVWLSASENVDPEDRLLADSLLVQAANGFGPWKDEAEEGIERFVTRGWAITVEQQRASLLSPSITAPSISAACGDESCHGLKKAARVVLAGKKAVRLRLADELIKQLKEISA